MKSYLPLLSLTFLISACATRSISEPTNSDFISAEAFSEFVTEIERLDGDVLKVRENRPIAWKKITERLKDRIREARSEKDLDQTFRQLDLSYPSQHAGHDFKYSGPAALVPKVRFVSNWITLDRVELVVSNVDSDFMVGKRGIPALGDRVVAINFRSIPSWFEEGFEFCKFPQKNQCDAEFAANFRLQRFSWTQEKPLVYTLERSGRTWDVNIPLRPSIGGGVTVDMGHGCSGDLDRYSDFQLRYAGNKACLYTSKRQPRTAILRISSFRYSEGEAIGGVRQEVDHLHRWLTRNKNLQKLIIDLADNSGGDSPLPYFRLFMNRSFQGPDFTKLKNIHELSDPKFRAKTLWDSPEAEAWYQGMVKSGELAKIPVDGFLPPMPKFCLGPPSLCDHNLIKPFPDAFSGTIVLIVNRYCMSACDRFTFIAKDLLNDRTKLVGEPTSADTGYSRLTVHLLKQKQNGLWTVLSAQGDGVTEQEWESQSVVTAETVNKSGELLDGHPVAIDTFVPTIFDSKIKWPDLAVSAAVKF